jgi:hypothetical protein
MHLYIYTIYGELSSHLAKFQNRWRRLEQADAYEVRQEYNHLVALLRRINPFARLFYWKLLWTRKLNSVAVDYHTVRDHFVVQHELKDSYRFDIYLKRCIRYVKYVNAYL